jgi:glutaredoxin 3
MLIEIFGLPNCTYCKQAAELCTAAGLDYVYTDLAKSPEQMDELESRIGRFKTVPQIFVNTKHVGGFDGLKEAMKNDNYN